MARRPRPALATLVLVAASAMGGCGRAERVHKAAGNMHLRRGELAQALQEFRIAAQLAPRDPGAPTLIGDALFEQGDLAGAAAAYQQALRLLPGAVDAHRGLAAVATRLGQRQEAKRHYEAILKSDPTDYRAHRALGLYAYADGDLDGAIRHLATALQAADGDPPSLYHLGLALAQKGNVDGATFAFDRLEKAVPGKAYAPYGRAVLFALQKDRERALLWLAEALRRGVEDVTKVEHDELLASLREDPRLAALLDGARKKAAATTSTRP
jgi:tetratricopeptide (TPR) repeat protein